MSVQIAVRLPAEQVAFIDHLVAAGEVSSRAELVSRAVSRIQRQHQALQDLEAIKTEPYDEFDGLHEWVATQQSDRHE